LATATRNNVWAMRGLKWRRNKGVVVVVVVVVRHVVLVLAIVEEVSPRKRRQLRPGLTAS
jgi:hypothetical protein